MFPLATKAMVAGEKRNAYNHSARNWYVGNFYHHQMSKIVSAIVSPEHIRKNEVLFFL